MNEPDQNAVINRATIAEMRGDEYGKFVESLFSKVPGRQRQEYLDWLLVQNPASRPAEDLPLYLLKIGEEPVGQVVIIPVKMRFGGEEMNGGWVIDFYVARKGWPYNAGARLIEAAAADFDLLMGLGQTDIAFNFLSRRMGWHFAGALTGYKLLLRPMRDLAKAGLKRIGIKFRNRGGLSDGPTPVERSGDVVRLGSFDEIETDSLASSSPGFGVPRTREFLDWRYGKMPGGNYVILKISDGDDRTSTAVMSHPKTEGWRTIRLVELLYARESNDEELERGVRKLIDYARQRGAEMFEYAGSDDRVLSVLPGGFSSKKGPAQRLLYGRGKSDSCQESDISQWMLGAGDCDVETMEGLKGNNLVF